MQTPSPIPQAGALISDPMSNYPWGGGFDMVWLQHVMAPWSMIWNEPLKDDWNRQNTAVFSSCFEPNPLFLHPIFKNIELNSVVQRR